MEFGSKRVEMLDVMRFVAAICVIFIHVSFTRRLSPDVGEFIRFLMRWAVPFFFLLTGYFFRGDNGFPLVTENRLCRILLITLTANVIYLPLVIIFDGIQSLDLKVVTSGTWFHLWFLSSLIVGILTLLLLPKLQIQPRYVTLAALSYILLAQGIDIVSSIDPGYLSLARLLRFGMAGPLMWIGFKLEGLSYRRPGPLLALSICLLGIVMCLLETCYYSTINTSIFDRQYSLGSLPMAVGAILWASSVQAPTNKTLVKIGRDYSIVIYIIHPLFLKLASLLVGHLTNTEWLPYWQVMLGSIFSVAFAYTCSRYLPFTIGLLKGDFPPPESQRLNNKAIS